MPDSSQNVPKAATRRRDAGGRHSRRRLPPSVCAPTEASAAGER